LRWAANIGRRSLNIRIECKLLAHNFHKQKLETTFF
jgi:hypothetical protein